MELNKIINSFYDVDYRGMVLPIITVYKNPLDFPDKYVARLFDLDKATNLIMVKDELREIRHEIPIRFYLMPPFQEDENHIVETYI